MKTIGLYPCLRWIAVVVLCLPLEALATPTDRIIIKVNEARRLSLLADGGPVVRAGERVASLSAAAGHDVAWLRAMSGGADVLRLPRALPSREAGAVAAALAKLPGVEYAEPDQRMFPARTPNDPRFGEQWHLQAVITSGQINYGIDAPAAWDITIGDAVTVAVLDTGVLFGHTDLRGKVLPGYDFISLDSAGVFRTANDGDGRDPGASDTGDWVTVAEQTVLGCEASHSSWHGTHVAGTIAAATDNGVGVAGINWRAMILPLRVLGKCGGYTSDITDAMRWATGLALSGVPQNPYPARILNLSLAAPGPCGITWQNAIDEVNNRGAVVIVAAGNEVANLDATPSSPCGVQRGAHRRRERSSRTEGQLQQLWQRGGHQRPGRRDDRCHSLHPGRGTHVSSTGQCYRCEDRHQHGNCPRVRRCVALAQPQPQSHAGAGGHSLDQQCHRFSGRFQLRGRRLRVGHPQRPPGAG
jgi:subtilisin family serine protease